MDTKAIGMETSSVATQNAAGLAITEVNRAIQAVSHVRSYYGAIQNRLEHTINNIRTVSKRYAGEDRGKGGTRVISCF